MTAARRRNWTIAQADRLIAYARSRGFPVDSMGLSVDGTKITLLPPGSSAASVADPVTDELEAFSKKHGYG